MKIFLLSRYNIPYVRDKNAVALFHFLLFSLCPIREGGLFKRVVYLGNLTIEKCDPIELEEIPDLDELDSNKLLMMMLYLN